MFHSSVSQKLATMCADLIKQHRTLKFTQTDFAKAVGVSRSTIQKLESGEIVKSDVLFEALVVLGLQGQFIQLMDDLTREVGGSSVRQRKRENVRLINDDF
ncbi:helix-turn-helix transcriptional regulator [Catenovulum agarivorans]|uniref:helix-turn-helix transcriptional regulator n=1 Tax=Catenovulum agarivorans TaxID=1172192 RepID=UPI00030BCE8C|nr:helix-turn-helix transcriptional regulator [Catenovulum agarivorans]